MLKATNLTAGYRDPIVRDASFELEKGKITGIVGANGTGKSTVIKTIAGLIPKHGGEIKIDGHLSYMPQHADVDWDFPATVHDLVIMGRAPRLKWWQWYSAEDKKRTSQALEQVGMGNLGKQDISKLSGGQRQRALLARTLVSDPDIVLLDEPFAGIDAHSQASIEEVLRELRGQGIALALVHHNLQEVAALCDNVIMLESGRISAQGPTSTTLSDQAIASMFSS
ncbi:manganese ABC transporter ATP-binding protein [Corynebacterium phocae]|uniref:Manganese ABC transporter ATP-binding protein n=1 Tax=Corynebacterium phocae TaxID=161895 RepID=A0A1L7D197_9CORY|nr:metal ABC transporter ATP-binding protein [Corynebacterium phocae]APT91843.1 manganese ABC transporter ATP-binding protein [Corynebacterium phocae]KAA8727452.1 metal ABC transporter ATP-binding protein [Corynebacterium phocae]